MSWECRLSIFVLFLLILEIFNVCASSSAPMCGNKAFTKVFSTGCKRTTEKKNASQVMREEPLSVAFVDLNDMLHFVLLWWFTEVKRIADESSLFSLSLFIGCDWLWLWTFQQTGEFNVPSHPLLCVQVIKHKIIHETVNAFLTIRTVLT